MERFSNTIAAYLRPGSAMAVWLNSRPKAGLSSEAKYLRHIEVESLPTGGWGCNYLPYVGRLARSFGLPLLGMTGRFHRSWGDMASLKPEAALRYECGQIAMHGLTVSVGDLLPPDAVPSAAASRPDRHRLRPHRGVRALRGGRPPPGRGGPRGRRRARGRAQGRT